MRKKLPPRLRFSHEAYYYAAYTTIDGVRRQKWDWLAADYGKALHLYAEREAQRGKGARDFKALWNAYKASSEFTGLADATRKAYGMWGPALVAVFGELLPEQVEQHHAQELMDRAKKRVTAQRMVSLLSTVLGWGARRGWLRSNPLAGMRKGAKSRRTRYISDAEWSALLAADAVLAPYLRLLHLTALRREDFIGLRIAGIKADGLHAHVRKSKKDIVIPWTTDLRQCVDDIRAQRGKVVGLYLLPGRHGRAPNGHTFYKAYKAAAAVAGCADVTLHDIRRKRLTDVTAQHGEEVARQLAVHTDIATTRGYNAAPVMIVRLPVERPQEAGPLSGVTKS